MPSRNPDGTDEELLAYSDRKATECQTNISNIRDKESTITTPTTERQAYQTNKQSL